MYVGFFIFRTLISILWITPGNYVNGSGQSSFVSWQRSSWRVKIHTDLIATTPSLAHLVSWNKAYSLPHKWGGKQCLLEVDLEVVHEIKDLMSDGDDMFHFLLVTTEFDMRPTKFTRPFIFKIFLLPMSGMYFVQCYPFYFLDSTFLLKHVHSYLNPKSCVPFCFNFWLFCILNLFPASRLHRAWVSAWVMTAVCWMQHHVKWLIRVVFEWSCMPFKFCFNFWLFHFPPCTQLISCI